MSAENRITAGTLGNNSKQIEAIEQALDAARKEGAEWMREKVIEAMPNTWLDPLLSGPKAVIKTSDNREIERLLTAVGNRIWSLPTDKESECNCDGHQKSRL